MKNEGLKGRVEESEGAERDWKEEIEVEEEGGVRGRRRELDVHNPTPRQHRLRAISYFVHPSGMRLSFKLL